MSHRAPLDSFDFEEISPQIRTQLSGTFEHVLRSADIRRERFRARREFVQSDWRGRAGQIEKGSDEES
jgi:hypothetical protein